MRDRCGRTTRYCLTITICLCSWYTLARRKHSTIIGSRLQIQARRDTSRGGSSRDDCTDVVEFRFAITYDCGRTIQIGVFQLASRLAIEQNEFVSRWCSLGKLCLGVSKDTGSSDSLRKVLVQRAREMDVAVNWLNCELVVGKGWQLLLRESC